MRIGPLITVGIVTRNRQGLLREAIQSVYKQNFPGLEIVVVDNASEDSTSEILRREYPAVRLIRLKENLGCPGGRNVLYQEARGEIIVNLDDDGLLGEGALPRLAGIFAADPSIGVVAMRLLDPSRPITAETGDKYWDTGLFWGGLAAFRRSMLEETGGYPEDFFFFKEEEFLALKILDAGWRIVYHPGIVIYHPCLNSRNLNETGRDYYLFRNPLFVVIELFPGIYMWKYLFLRVASYALVSLRRKSFVAYCRALGSLPGKLLHTLPRRHPVSLATLRKYFALREDLPVPEAELSETCSTDA